MVDQHDPVPVPAGRVRAQQFACTAADGVPLVGDHFAGAAARGGIGTAVFAHGFGQTRHAWHASARAIAGHGWETRCFDARGHGQSGWNDADQAYRLDQFVADARTIAGIGARPPVWVGASMGGLLGLLAQGEAEAAQGAAPHGSAGPFAALVLVGITPRRPTRRSMQRSP